MVDSDQVLYNSTAEKALQRLFDLSKPKAGELDFKVDGSIWKDGIVLTEEPSENQKRWIERRMKGSASTWEAWNY